LKNKDQLKEILLNKSSDLANSIPSWNMSPESETNRKIYQATKINPIPHETLIHDPNYWIEGLGYHFKIDAFNNDVGLRKYWTFDPNKPFDPEEEHDD